MRRAGVMLGFGLTLATAFAVTRPTSLGDLPLPPRGEVWAEWLGGPSAHGLRTWRPRIRGDRVIVGASRAPAPRDAIGPDRGMPDQACWQREDPGDVDPDTVLQHGRPFHADASIDGLRAGHRAGTFVVHGMMLEHPDGSVQFCDAVDHGPPPRCEDEGLVLSSSGPGSGRWWALQGWFRLRVAHGVVHRAGFLAITAYGPFHDPAQPEP